MTARDTSSGGSSPRGSTDPRHPSARGVPGRRGLTSVPDVPDVPDVPVWPPSPRAVVPTPRPAPSLLRSVAGGAGAVLLALDPHGGQRVARRNALVALQGDEGRLGRPSRGTGDEDARGRRTALHPA